MSSDNVPLPSFVPGVVGYSRCVVQRNYALLSPKGLMSSFVPALDKTVVHFLAAPMLGARFVQAILNIAPEGGMLRSQRDEKIQHFYYVLDGTIAMRVGGDPEHTMTGDGYAYIPPGIDYALRNEGATTARVIWLKKFYERIDLETPEPILSSREEIPCVTRPGLEGRGWQYLLPKGDFRFDMEMNILSFAPGTYFSNIETHVMEHGLFMLEGSGLVLLEHESHEIWTNDFVWMGPFCPQIFYPIGPNQAVYLLYKNMNRDIQLVT